MLLHALNRNAPLVELQNSLEQTQLFSRKTLQVRFQSFTFLKYWKDRLYLEYFEFVLTHKCIR